MGALAPGGTGHCFLIASPAYADDYLVFPGTQMLEHTAAQRAHTRSSRKSCMRSFLSSTVEHAARREGWNSRSVDEETRRPRGRCFVFCLDIGQQKLFRLRERNLGLGILKNLR